ncbi:MAG: hypothetical protein IPG58_06810 [Acidobacteria bacterium]|nr:hypothetical protein [Acidobacteriota bacterium]
MRRGWPVAAAACRQARPFTTPYAYWERHPVALRPDQLEQLAAVLNISVSDLMGEKEEKKRGTGPTGRMKQLFEQANDLPRSQQQKIAAVLEAFISQQRQRRKAKRREFSHAFWLLSVFILSESTDR